MVIDGTLIPIDRVAADRPFYSGKHRHHGMNLQVIAAPWSIGPPTKPRPPISTGPQDNASTSARSFTSRLTILIFLPQHRHATFHLREGIHPCYRPPLA